MKKLSVELKFVSKIFLSAGKPGKTGLHTYKTLWMGIRKQIGIGNQGQNGKKGMDIQCISQ